MTEPYAIALIFATFVFGVLFLIALILWSPLFDDKEQGNLTTWWCPDCELSPPQNEIEAKRVLIRFHKECGSGLNGPINKEQS